MDLSDEFLNRIKQGINHFSEKRLKLKKDMVDWFPKERKTIFSVLQHTRKYPLNFQFEISKNAGQEILKNQEGVLFKLGGSVNSPDRTLLVNFVDMKKLLTNTTINPKSQSWMFRISFNNEKPIFRITDRKTEKEKLINLNKSELNILK